MLKWISLIAFLPWPFPVSAMHWMTAEALWSTFFAVTLCALTLLLGVVTFLRWRTAFKARPTLLNQLVMLVPVLATAVFLACFILTYHKVHKPYDLSAIRNGDTTSNITSEQTAP